VGSRQTPIQDALLGPPEPYTGDPVRFELASGWYGWLSNPGRPIRSYSNRQGAAEAPSPQGFNPRTTGSESLPMPDQVSEEVADKQPVAALGHATGEALVELTPDIVDLADMPSQGTLRILRRQINLFLDLIVVCFQNF
jgi:hypothetical protein